MTAAEVISLKRWVDEGGDEMSNEQVRTVRIETELRFHTTRERLFRALTDETLEWFPHSYGDDRTKAIVVEPRVGGAHYEDWGDGTGYLYGHVTMFDPPTGFSTRGRIMPGTILDTHYALEENGDEVVLKMSKVAVGPMTEDEAGSIRTYGDIANFEDALRALVESSTK